MTPFKIQAAKTTETSSPLIKVDGHWGMLSTRPEFLERDVVQIGPGPGTTDGGEFWKKYQVDMTNEIYPGGIGGEVLCWATRDPLALAIARAWTRLFYQGLRPRPGPIRFDADSLWVEMPPLQERKK